MHINPLDPNGVAVCPSGFDCVRYAYSAQDDSQAFVVCTCYNGNNGRFVNRPYETTKVSGNIHDIGEQSFTLRKDRIFGRITKQAMPEFTKN